MSRKEDEIDRLMKAAVRQCEEMFAAGRDPTPLILLQIMVILNDIRHEIGRCDGDG